MIEVELSEPRSTTCDCCGSSSTVLTRFVHNDGAAYAVYFAQIGAHGHSRVCAVVSIGEWGEEATPQQRFAFALELRLGPDNYEIMVVDAATCPWSESEFIGQKLDRQGALSHPRIKEVFHITDHFWVDDPLLRAAVDATRQAEPS